MSLQPAAPARSQLTQKVHCLATLWKIERVDGLNPLRLTDHCRVLPFFETNAYFDYTPQGGFSSSAQQRLSGLDEQNLEGLGEISSAAITDDDLRAGRYREAKITTSVVDWRYPWLGPIEEQAMWVVETTHDREKWKAQLSGIPGWLRYNKGEVFTRTCGNDLFDVNCIGGDAPFLDRSAMTGFLCRALGTSVISRSLFSAQGPFGGGLIGIGGATINTQAVGYFNNGRLTWRTGLNQGVVSEVKTTTKSVPSSPFLQISLQIPTPFAIADDDEFDIEVGCDKVAPTCKTKFVSNNFRNFAGHLFIPGTDKQFQSAGAV